MKIARPVKANFGEVAYAKIEWHREGAYRTRWSCDVVITDIYGSGTVAYVLVTVDFLEASIGGRSLLGIFIRGSGFCENHNMNGTRACYVPF